MFVFILDDNIERQLALVQWVRMHDAETEFVIADSIDSAREWFRSYRYFDLMLLDHDLGGRVFVDSNEENTGYQVAKEIVKQGIYYKKAIIHTLNYSGAMNMKDILPSAEVVPIIYLLQSRL